MLGAAAPLPREFVWGGATPASQPGINLGNRHCDDIVSFAEVGFPVFGLSIAWSRIFPNGDDEAPDEEGLAFYDRLLDECARDGVEPLVTLSPSETPPKLTETYGGWVSRELIGFYERHVRTVFERYRGKVTYWLIDGESSPSLYAQRSSDRIDSLSEGPNRRDLFQAVHHGLVASALATRIAHEVLRGSQVGCLVIAPPIYSRAPDPTGADAAMEHGHPSLLRSDVRIRGAYPGYALRYFRENGIELDITTGDREVLTNTVDFVALNYSTSATRRPPRSVWDRWEKPLFVVEQLGATTDRMGPG